MNRLSTLLFIIGILFLPFYALPLYSQQEGEIEMKLPGIEEGIKMKVKIKEGKTDIKEEYEEKEETNDYLLIRKKTDDGSTIIKILEPEGALVEIRTDKGLLPLHRADIPTLKEIYSPGFYRIIVTGKGGKWEKKIEIKKGMEHILYIKTLSSVKEAKTEIKVKEKIYPISPSSFRSLLRTLRSENFEDTRLEILQDAADRNYFTVSQLIDILELFEFEENKIEACKIIYPKLVDKKNFHEVYSAFEFSSSKEELREWIKKYEKGGKEEEGWQEGW